MQVYCYREQIQLVVRAGLELGASESYVQRSNHSDTMPPIFFNREKKKTKKQKTKNKNDKHDVLIKRVSVHTEASI